MDSSPQQDVRGGKQKKPKKTKRNLTSSTDQSDTDSTNPNNGPNSSGVSSMGGGSASSGVPKPRSLRFTWNMKTTSSMDPADMMSEIRKVLDNNNCDYEQRERFLLLCSYQESSAMTSAASSHHGTRQGGQSEQAMLQGAESSVIQWEMEVCKLPRLSLNGVRFKRISGTSIGFKQIASKIANELKL